LKLRSKENENLAYREEKEICSDDYCDQDRNDAKDELRKFRTKKERIEKRKEILKDIEKKVKESRIESSILLEQPSQTEALLEISSSSSPHVQPVPASTYLSKDDQNALATALDGDEQNDERLSEWIIDQENVDEKDSYGSGYSGTVDLDDEDSDDYSGYYSFNMFNKKASGKSEINTNDDGNKNYINYFSSPPSINNTNNNGDNLQTLDEQKEIDDGEAVEDDYFKKDFYLAQKIKEWDDDEEDESSD
jgi:hypothetical protein